MTHFMVRDAHIIADVVEQKKWILEHGQCLSGYIERYGNPEMEFCYGNGGSAIYEADKNELERRIDRALHKITAANLRGN